MILMLKIKFIVFSFVPLSVFNTTSKTHIIVTFQPLTSTHKKRLPTFTPTKKIRRRKINKHQQCIKSRDTKIQNMKVIVLFLIHKINATERFIEI